MSVSWRHVLKLPRLERLAMAEQLRPVVNIVMVIVWLAFLPVALFMNDVCVHA